MTRHKKPSTPARRGILIAAIVVSALVVAGIASLLIVNAVNSSAPPVSTPFVLATETPAPSTTTTSAPAAPSNRFDPSATVDANFIVFNTVTNSTISATPSPVGADFTAGLVSAGFDQAAIEVTADKTSIDLVAPAIVFSVKVADKCLLGQYSPSDRQYNDQIVDPISTGNCLIGETVAQP